MPPASMSLLFTWSVESVLMGLLGVGLFGCTWPMLSQLILASATAVAHLALAATQSDLHHDMSVPYLCVVTGLTAVHALGPLTSLWDMIGLCFFIVVELAALGMTFASCEDTTTLFLHSRGIGAVLIIIALDAACWEKWVGLGVGLAFSVLVAYPSNLIAPISTAMAALALLIRESIVGDWARFAVAACIMAVAMMWGVMSIMERMKPIGLNEIPVVAPPVQPHNQITWPRLVRPMFKDL